jgi:NitT/TauT family transport system permease protein
MTDTVSDLAVPGVAFVTDDAEHASFVARKRRLAWRKRLLPIIAFVAIVLLWEMSVHVFSIKSFIAPAPSAVAVVLYEKFGVLMQNLWPTVVEAITGFAIGNLAAILLATTFVHKPTAEDAFFPIAVMFNTIPTVAKAPILVLILGNGLQPKIAIAAIICFFPTLVNMTRGLKDVNPQQLELMHVLSASQREIFLKVRFKNALPYLFSALKISASTAVVGAIIGEWVGATTGIGALIIQATYNFDTPLLYATIVVGSVFSASFFGVITMLEGHFLKWNVERAR